MGYRFGMVRWLLVAALLLPSLPSPAGAEEAAPLAAEAAPLFEDGFDGGLGNWDLFGSTAWQVQGSGAEAQLTGSTTATSPQRAVAKASKLPYSSKDYALEFDAKGDRFRALFRYSSGTSYYFLEFKNARQVELWKYPNSSAAAIVGDPVDIGAALPGFSLTDWHSYRVEARGGAFKLAIDGTPVAEFADSSLASGGIGFALKSVGPAATVSVDNVAVRGLQGDPPPDPATIVHTPASQVPYNADLPIAFTVAGLASSAEAAIHYGYGAEPTDRVVEARGDGNGSFAGTIPGTNRADSIRYYLTVEEQGGGSVRYPETGDVAVPIEAMEPYSNDFEGETPNSAPAGWTTGGSAKVLELPDGNKVFSLNGSGSAKLNLPMYRNADNFVVRFKAKYERTSDAVQNTWRLRYRAADDANNNAMEWATHNSKYFLMRKTTLGGNYYIANYVKSLLGDWHDYELRISGISHKLYIDGELAASGDDSDALAREKGYFQWNVVGGINLQIDDFAIEPIPLPYVVDLQPSGTYAGIYEQGEAPGLALALDAGSAAHEFRIDYAVRRADGDKALVASGSETYELAKGERRSESIRFAPGVSGIGTYDVAAEFSVDGAAAPSLTKRMRLAIVDEAAPVQEPDLDNESVFGLNTHYALNWRDDIIDGARKLGARHHRSGLSWEAVDRNAKDSAGNAVYDYAAADALLGKLESYGFNQITVLGIDKNAAYQSGTANTPAALKAMGDFVYDAVSRYKGRIRQWEMPNEPEIFSKPYVPEEFVQIQKIAYLRLKQADPDAMLLAGDHTSSVLSVLPRELELGSYDYADAYSFHPYVYNSMPDGNLANLLNGVKNLVNAYGGWKDYYLTEGGWPTANAGYPSVSEETQRDYIVRAFLTYLTTDQVKAYEYYNYKNDGTDDRYYDIFWGITDNDGRPKLAYAAVHQLMTTLDRARYIGTWDAGDPAVAAELFLTDAGEPVLVAWKRVDHKDDPDAKPPTSEIALPFGAAGTTAKDINGVGFPLAESGGKAHLTVGSSPVYVTGLPAGFVYEAAARLLAGKAEDAAAKLEALRTAENGALVDADSAKLDAISATYAEALGSSAPAAGLERGIKAIYALMETMAGRIGDGAYERAPGYVALEALYNEAERASVPLSYAMGGLDSAVVPDYGPAAQAATAALDAKKGEYGVMPVSTAAVLRTNRYGRLAEAAAARGAYAASYAYNLLAREFAPAAEAIVASEPSKFIGVMASVVPTQAAGEAGGTAALSLALANDTDSPRTVGVAMKLPDGWEAAQTSPREAEYEIPAGGSLEEAYEVRIPADAVKGRYDIAFEVYYEGALLDTKTVRLTVEDGIGVRLVPVAKTIADLDVLTVELTGTSSLAKTGTVTVVGPDGAALAPVSTNAFGPLNKGGKVRLDFQWTYRERKPGNEYPVDVRVEEAATGKTIFRDAAMPVDFLLAQKARGVEVDGDLSDWQDAFPFHLRSSAQNAGGYHDPDNLEATAYVKWADDGLYVAAVVRDDIHKQSENASNLWKNDSVQASLDPLDDGGSPYGPDDVEWGFALTDDGQKLTNVFSSSAPNPNGDISGRVPFAAVRDETAKRTIYEMKFPSSFVRDLRPAEGARIALNVAVNDADLQNGRDDFIQWTPGTADSKNPSLYDSFLLVDEDTIAPELRIDGSLTLSRLGRTTLTWEASDSHGEVESASVRLDGRPIGSPYEIRPLSLEAGEHRLSGEAVDRAGNRSVLEATLRVTFSVGELDDMLNYGFAQGWIRNKGVLNSLLAKAVKIQKDAAKDNKKVDFKPLIQEIEAQSGKKITAEFAASLRKDIDYLRGPAPG